MSTHRLPAATWVAACLAALALCPAGASAQELPLKRALPDAQSSPCQPLAPAAEPSAEEARQATELASEASQALILGERERARDLLARANDLNPGSAALAYRYGQVLEDLGARTQAVAAYCRAVGLAPDTPDAADARIRIVALAQPAADPIEESALESFRVGLTEADAGRLESAAEAFTTATDLAPGWADAHYNRGAVLARLGQRAAASEALRRYLELEGNAADALAVSERIGRLDAAYAGEGANPSAALGLGILPGMGQIYTGRPGLGLGFLGLTGALVGASAWAEEGDDRTFVTPGLYVAGGVAAIGALEAFMAARRERADGRVAALGPDAAFTLGLLPGMGQFYRGRVGSGFAVMSMAAAAAAGAFLHEEGEGRGYFSTGLGTAAVVTGLAALEASFDARRRQRGPGALPPDPGAALALGLLPGLGQFYQGRVGTGLGFLGLTAALTSAANLTECCDRREYVMPGLALAGGVVAVGALEAFMDARRVQLGAEAPPPNPGVALALGLIPGMGQFYTGRPAGGLAILTLASAATATSFMHEEGRGRGLFKQGFIAAGAVTAIGAIEAFVHARGWSGPAGGGMDAPEAGAGTGLTLQGPALVGGGPGLGMQLLGVRF